MDFIERHSPASLSWLEHGHSSLQRYAFALNFVSGRVLDVACGTGYGTYVLGNRASHVTGVDFSEEAIQEAQARNHRPNVEYILGALEDLALPADSFSCVVSLETIEHLPDPKGFVKETARVLAPGGRLILSAPNALQYSKGTPPMLNPHHLNEPTFEELVGWLEPFFGIDEAWEQSACRTLLHGRVAELGFKTSKLGQPWFYRFLAAMESRCRSWLRKPLPEHATEPDRSRESALLAEMEILPLVPDRRSNADTFVIVATKRG